MIPSAVVARRGRVASFMLLLGACAPFVACSSTDGDAGASSSGGEVFDGSTTSEADGGTSTDAAPPDATTPDAAPLVACGRLATPCPNGGKCEGAPDCQSGNCRAGTCQDISPTNGAKDGDETDVDCGGTKAPACADGKGCAVAADCTSSVCTGATCQAPTNADGVRNGTETGVDCGGTSGKACASGQGCKSNADCDKLKCDPATTKCLPASNADGVQNGTETDVDCGGGAPTNAPRCAQGKGCAENADCAGVVSCDANTKTCNLPSSTDGLKNGTETDVDCGGGAPTNAPKCAAGSACSVAADCIDECIGGKCVAPTSSDNKKNGNESDVDCGSSGPGTDTGADRCSAGKTCANDNDCKSGGCNHKGVCAAARSCKAQNGGTTCGTGDASRANQNEDCCESAVVPSYNADGYNNTLTDFRLDKYTITAGRIRAFLNAVGGNVQAWVQANRASVLDPTQLPSGEDKFLPVGWTQPDSADECDPDGNGAGNPLNPKCNYGALNHVSGYRYNNGPGGDNGYGCYVNDGGFSTRTYYTTAAEDAAVGINERQLLVSRARADQKAMTCTTYYIFAAFCAWDGGRLETLTEYNAAYGGNGSTGRTFPWTATIAFPDPSRPIGFKNMGGTLVSPLTNYGYTPTTWMVGADDLTYSVFNPGLTAQQRADLLARIDRVNFSWNYYDAQILDYRAPLEGRATNAITLESNINVANDASVAVAPPGRYPNGAGRYGHRDLLGNVIEITATGLGTANRTWARNGSFETAHFNATTMTAGTYSKAPLTKYGRAGARCVRPISGYLAAPLP